MFSQELKSACSAVCASMELCDNENVLLYRDWSRSKAWLLNMFHEVVTKLSSTGTDTQHQVCCCHLHLILSKISSLQKQAAEWSPDWNLISEIYVYVVSASATATLKSIQFHCNHSVAFNLQSQIG